MPEGSSQVDFGVGRHDGPIRTCVGCRKEDHQGALVRLVATPEGVVTDVHRRSPGRGAYLHPKTECVEQAVKRGAVLRALRTTEQSGTKTPSWAIAVLQLEPPAGSSDKESSGDEHTMSARA